MRAANLDDVVILLRLALQSFMQAAQSRQCALLQCEHRGNVHGCWKGVVGRLTAIDMVIGMHRRLATQLPAQNLNGTVADDFVGVHVCLCATSRLPHDEREMIVQLARANLVCSLVSSPIQTLESILGYALRLSLHRDYQGILNS